MTRLLTDVARECGFLEDDVLPYGRDKAKIRLEAIERLRDRPQGN